MSIHINKKAIFFHIPKTGGTWANKAMKNSGIYTEVFTFEDSPHNTYNLEDIKNKYTFTFVRHPFEFYRSYWCYRMKNGWIPSWWLDKNCKSYNFEEFLKNILKINFPYVSKLYKDFIGEPQVLNFIGKQEYLIDDLIHVLRFLNIDFEENKLRNTKRTNISEFNPNYSNELKQKIIELEKIVIRNYYYERN